MKINMNKRKSTFKHNFGIFSIILYIGFSYFLSVACLNPEFWNIQTTWIFRSGMLATSLSALGFVLSTINWKVIKEDS
jgi:hypothetical protein